MLCKESAVQSTIREDLVFDPIIQTQIKQTVVECYARNSSTSEGKKMDESDGVAERLSAE